MKKNIKGQESAPIEVLIGVTILTFVLIIAMNIFQNSCSSQYEQKLNADFSKFSRDLEFVYMGAAGTSITTKLDLSVPEGCSSIHLKSINLLQGIPSTCKAQLGKGECMMLQATLMPDNPTTSSDNEILTVQVVDIPNSVEVINSIGTCLSVNLNSYDVTDINNLDQNCRFRPTYYNLRITKTSPNTITIS